MDKQQTKYLLITQVKMEDAHKLLKIPKSECPDIWIRLPRHKWPKSWYSMEDPVVPLERNLYGHPLAGLLWERQFEKILSSTACTAAMAKRAQQGSGEERVTAKSKPMTARMPSVVSSSTSSNPVRTSCGNQDPGKSVAGDDRSGKPERPSPPGCSKEDYGQSWSSQEWKSGVAAHDRSGKPWKTSWDILQKVAPHREEPFLDGNAHSVRYGETIHDGSGKPENLNHQEEAKSENFVMGSDAAEFVDKVKDQVRNRQKRMSNVAESGEEHSIIWGMFMAATMNAATFMGKNFSTIQNFVMNSEDLTLKQMFDVTAQLVNNQDEINGLDKIQWEKNSWKRLSLIGDETVINLQRTKVCLLSVCVVLREDPSTS